MHCCFHSFQLSTLFAFTSNGDGGFTPAKWGVNVTGAIFALAIASLDVARFGSVLSLSVKFVTHFIAFLGQMHTDREEGATSSLLYKRASRCQHVSSLSRLKTILAH